MSPRLPGRHDQPVTPLQMSVTDAVVFAQQIHAGFGGQATWHRPCECGHLRRHHRSAGRCRHSRCSCPQMRPADHEIMIVGLHPDAINYLPEDVYVIEHNGKYERLGDRPGDPMGPTYKLGRDLGVSTTKVIHGGVRKTTHVYTDEPEGWHDRPHEGPVADERLDRPKEGDE